MTTYRNRPIFPFAVEWASAVERSVSYDPHETEVGFGKPSRQPTAYAAVHTWSFSVLIPDDAAATQAEGFVADLGGRQKGFWIIGSPEFTVLSEANGSQVKMRVSGMIGGIDESPADFLVFFKRGEIPVARRLIQVTPWEGDETFWFDAALPAGIDETWDAARLYYVRLAEDEQEFVFTADNFGTWEVKVVELPTEYALVDLGIQPIWLYAIWTDSARWRFTSYASAVTRDGLVYGPAAISHSGLSTSTRLEKEELSVQSWFGDWNPFCQFLPYPPAERMFVKVSETFLGSNDINVIWEGAVRKVSFEGKRITATVGMPVDLDGMTFPRFMIQRRCNNIVYDTCCGLSAAVWKANATFVSQAGTVATVVFAGGRAFSKSYFANGWIERGAGVNLERRAIVASSGNTVELAAPLVGGTAGEPLSLWPGCPLTAEACGTKFNNFSRFGGFPCVPTDNPTINIPTAKTGGKK